jgi:hypothetical protein
MQKSSLYSVSEHFAVTFSGNSIPHFLFYFDLSVPAHSLLIGFLCSPYETQPFIFASFFYSFFAHF